MSQDDFDSILEEINASAEEIKAFDTLYAQYIGENKLTLDNLVENKIKIKTSEYTISLSKSVGNLVSTVVVDGSRTIKLKTEDQQMEVNGAEVSIQ
jgi:cell fate regulator YaaT (PSP1 superfamily)